MDNSLASGESDPLSDVASAWKSLWKAQAVLQRIENKFYHQMWSCAKSQAARRKLWHEKSFDGQRNRDETALNEKKSYEIPPASRKRNCAALSPAWTQTCFLESPAVSSGPPRMTPLSPWGGSRSAPCSPARREAADGEGTAGTRSPAKSLYRPRWDNFREQADSRGCRVEKEKSLFSLHHPSHCPAGSSLFSAVPYGSWNNAPMPMSVLVPTHHLPSASRPRDQKLEELWKKSPQKKLEQLKKRIQEQRQKQQRVSQDQKCLISPYGKGPPQRRPLKRKVCRVASAPPAPVYRDQRDRSSAWRIQTQSQRQPSPKSSALERAAKDKCVKLLGASAWREGQKLARKLLGPPPTFPNLRSAAEEQTTANNFEPGRRSVAMANSFREKGNEPVGKSPEFKSCVMPPSKLIARGSNAPTKDTKQILRNLHLQSHCHDDPRHTRLPKDPVKGKVEVLQQYLGIHPPSPGPQPITPSAFSGEKTQSLLMKDRAKPSSSGNCCRGKSASPQRQKGSSSPAQKGSEKENLKLPSKRRVNIKKPHPYSPEIVQEFMYRKNEERKKKSLEEKKSLVQAMEMRNKRLQEVYRKQKEAIGKKIRSDQLCRLIRETASAKGSPQRKLEQEHNNGGILESNFKACVDKTPCILLTKDHRSRNQLLSMVQSPKKRAELASPAPLESEFWFLSPLKCEDLRGCSPPALQTPLSFSLPQKDAKSYSQDLSSDLSPYRSKQDRMKAIHSLSKELAEKIEVATKRLNAASWAKDSAYKTSTETTLDLYHELSSVPEPETSKDEQDRTMTIQMLLDTPDPGVLHVSSDMEFHGQGRISFVGSTERATALDRQKEMPTSLPGGSAASKELPWVTHGAGQRHLKTGKDLSNTLQGFPMNKGSKVDISLLHEKPITSPASPSHRFLARSPQRELPAQRNRYRCETVLKVQNQEEIANRSPRESHRSQPSATLSPGAETHHSLEQDLASSYSSVTSGIPDVSRPQTSGIPEERTNRFSRHGNTDSPREIEPAPLYKEKLRDGGGTGNAAGGPREVTRWGSFSSSLTAAAGEGDPSCTELEEKHRSHLDNLRQTSILLTHKLKVHQLQQKQQLMVLREKAKLEVQESQRFLSDLLQHNPKECSSSKGRYSVPRLDHAEQMWKGSQSEGDNAAGSNQETRSLKQSALKTERDYSPVDPKTVGERKPLEGRGLYCSGLREGSLLAEHGKPVHDHQTLNLLSPPVNLPHGKTCAGDSSGDSSEQTSSDSRWSEVGQHYGGSSTFCCFSLAMVEQCLRGEELRARHQAALLKLSKKALQEKARAELAWLDHQKRCLEDVQDGEGASAMAAKQCQILMELKQEQAEIQHLQNIYRAAHQERKLLLKQQREILMMHHSTAQLQEKLHNLAGKPEVIKSQSLDVSLTRSPVTEEGIKLNTVRLIPSPKLYSSSAEPTVHPEMPDLSGNRESCVQLKNKQSKEYEGFSTENKRTLVQYQKEAKESPGLEQSLDVQGPDASETLAREVCGATSQTTGSVFMIKDCINTELNAQDHVLLPLEHANSAKMDELISTPITREGRRHAFLESVLKEKAFISNPKIDPKDNEDINPCDSKFTVKGLGMLSTWCNLCLVQAENTLQGTGDATSSLKDQEKEPLTVEKVFHGFSAPRMLREEWDVCSPFQDEKRKEDLSCDDEDEKIRSAVISDEATLVKTELRKERSSEQQRINTDSERKSEIKHIDEKAPSDIPLSEVKEVEVSVPDEIHQVDGNQCLKHLDHVCHEASYEELNLKAFSKGLASPEILSKPNNFSLRYESAKSDSSLPEFQKVSAVWIDISESFLSDSELELKNGEDTDVSIPEEFVYDNGDTFPNVLKEMLTAISNGKEMLPSDKHDKHEVTTGDGTKTSSYSQKYPGDVSDHGCTDDLFSFIPPDKANASKTKSARSSQSDNPAKGMDVPLLDASENYSRSKTFSQEIMKQGKDAVASSPCSDGIHSLKIHEQQKPSSPTGRVKKDGGINSLFVDQNRDLMGFLLTGSLKCLDEVTDQFSSTLAPHKDTLNDKSLACLSTRNLAVSGGENNHVQLLNGRLASTTCSKIVSLSTSMPEISKTVHTETNSLESLQREATGDQNNSTTERQAIEKARRERFSSVSSKNQFFQVENCSSKGEDDTIFISDEDLPPTDEDTLSEILSPVDEVLSYGSADLPSSNKKDLSFPSEDLPPPPLGADAMKNDDPSFSTDDFPSPPEQMTVSETRQCMDEDISLKMDTLPPLPDNTVCEEFPLLHGETTDAFSTQDGSLSEQSLVKDTSSAKEGLLEYHEGEHETALLHLEFLPVSNPISSGQASKSPDFKMKQCKANLTLPKAEEDSDDPLLSFEIGDRVLVKQTQPGTLMFKGRTCFDSGHWAGVALDKAEGDNAGTYKGVKYFECAQDCGVFVRPGEISHLLGTNENASNYTGDEDSDSSCDDKSFKGDYKSSEDDKQEGGLTEQKAEDTNSAGRSEVKENQSRLHLALLSGKGQKLPRSDQCKCNEFLCQNNLTCFGSDKEKTELTQIKQRILAGVLSMKSKASNTDEVKTGKNICCLVEDQKINTFTDDIASELVKKLLFDTLIAFSETAQHKYKRAFEKDMMNYGKGLRQEDNQKPFLLKENSVAILPEQSAKVSDVLLCDLDMPGIHGCYAVAERIVTKFVDDAVKEYKKIKRKHGLKADKIFHSPSETSPPTLPFLVKILDAGVFGSSEDFDKPNFDQHMLVRQTQKQCFYKLDQWHSAPWKKTVEVPLVIPHYSSYVKKLSAHAVEELWTPENIYSNFRRISMPKHFECNDLPGNDLETESKRMYNQVICDLTREVLCAEYQVTTNANTFPWMKENLKSYHSRHLCRRTDVNEVKMFVQGEIIKIMNLEKNDLEMKRKFRNMTKYGNCKRDRVDLILIQELHKEESQWTYYDDDELTVKMRMTEGIFDSLILDTIRVLNKIYRRKTHN